jgi:hypothetical protein
MGKKRRDILSVLKAIGALIAMTRPAVVVKAEAERFINLAGGWIKDVKTGLEWGPSSDKSMKFDEAKKYCADQGGRIPTVDELFSLVDRTKYNPATTMPGMKSEWYWASDPVAWNSGGAWYINFFSGSVGCYDKDSGFYVSPVRSSQ